MMECKNATRHILGCVCLQRGVRLIHFTIPPLGGITLGIAQNRSVMRPESIRIISGGSGWGHLIQEGVDSQNGHGQSANHQKKSA